MSIFLRPFFRAVLQRCALSVLLALPLLVARGQDSSALIHSVSPSTIPLAGAYVTVFGSNLNTARIRIGGKDVKTFTTNSPTAITFIAPASAAGVFDVTATDPNGRSTQVFPETQVTYTSAPIVLVVSPSSGGLEGGYEVTIIGFNLEAPDIRESVGNYITIEGGRQIFAIIRTGERGNSRLGSTALTFTVPSAHEGVFNVTVLNQYGISVPNQDSSFEYTDQPIPLPIVTGLNSSLWSTSGGLPVRISGSNFGNVYSVNVGGTKIVDFTQTSATSISFRTPAGDRGAFHVTVTSSAGTSRISAADRFEYSDDPWLAAVTREFSGTIADFNPQKPTANRPQPKATVVNIAAVLDPGGITGKLVGFLAGLNAGFVAPFTVNADGTFQTSTKTLVVDSAVPQSLVINGTISGTVDNLTLSGTIAPLGLTFSLTSDPTEGASVGIGGLYDTRSVQSAAGETYTVIGSQGEVFVLLISPRAVSAGAGSLVGNTFVVNGSGLATITGAINPGTTQLAESVTIANGGTMAFAGVGDTTIPTDRLINCSARSMVTPAHPLVGGFVVTGATAKTLVIRGVGPGLAAFGIPGFLAHPQLALTASTGAVLATSSAWGGSAALTAAFVQVGAFALAPASADCALEMSLSPGAYTFQVSDAVNDAGGVALAEVYDASIDLDGVTQKLVNISCLGTVGGAAAALNCGFVVSGNRPKQVLVRGVGPSLTAFGVPSVVSNPVLNVYDSVGNLVATNNDWGIPLGVNATQTEASAAQLSAAATQSGAFPLLNSSLDAALIVALPPGGYTAAVTTTGSAGTGLVEVYEVGP